MQANIGGVGGQWTRGGATTTVSNYSKFINYTGTHQTFRNAKRHLQVTVAKFVKDIHCNMGVHVMVFTGYKNADGNIVKSKSVHLIVCGTKS